MAIKISDIWKKVQSNTKEANSVAGYGKEVESLPFQLRDEYNKRQDPALNKAISEKQNQVLGGAIEGLNKYQDVVNPFTRRALAEKYQSGLSTGLSSLTDERTRRVGVYEDYITKWSGLYGADLAYKKNILANKQESVNQMMGVYNLEESKRQADEDKRRYEQGSKKENFLLDAVKAINASKGTDGKADPQVYGEVRDIGIGYGLTPQKFDSLFGNKMAENEWEGLGISPAQNKSITVEENEYGPGGRLTKKTSTSNKQ